MASQFLTAVGAFVGTFLGIWIAETAGTGNKEMELQVGQGLFGTSTGAGELVIPMTAGGEAGLDDWVKLMLWRLLVHCECQCDPGVVSRIKKR